MNVMAQLSRYDQISRHEVMQESGWKLLLMGEVAVVRSQILKLKPKLKSQRWESREEYLGVDFFSNFTNCGTIKFGFFCYRSYPIPKRASTRKEPFLVQSIILRLSPASRKPATLKSSSPAWQTTPQQVCFLPLKLVEITNYGLQPGQSPTKP